MAGAGTVEIDFAAETSKFTAELKKVRADLKSLQTDVSGISGALASAGKIFTGIFSAALIGAGVRAVVKATEEAAEASARLDQALKSSSVAAQLSLAALKDYSTQLQRTTTVSDEAVQNVESLLLSFRSLSGDTVLRATSAVVDLSARMGTDLASAAKLVGRALEDPQKGLTALARAGVVFSESQKAIIKGLIDSGDRAQAQGIILGELEKRFKGSAEAIRNTLGGALAGLKNSFSDLLEAKEGAPGLTSAINSLANTLSSPGVQKGFDLLTSFLVNSLTLGAQFVDLLGQIGAGISKALGGGTGDQIDQLNQKIQLLVQQRSLSRGGPVPGGGNVSAQERELRAELARLSESRGHGVIKGSAADDAQVDDDALARLKHQSDVLEIRQKALTASISDAGRQLDELDKQLGDGETNRTKLDEQARKERIDSLRNFAKDQLDIAASETDRRLKLEQDLTERINEEQRKRVAAEVHAQQQMLEARQNLVLASVAILTFLVSGHNKASKAIAAAQKAQALISIYRNTAEAASKALTLGPILGPPAAAAMIALGAIQAAAVLSERAPGSRGATSAAFDVGATSASNTTQTSIATQPLGAQQKPQSVINVFGWSEAAIRDLVRRMKDEIEDHDLTLIRQP